MDLQQRSCEFLEILGADWDSHRPGILDRMPVPEKDGTGDRDRDGDGGGWILKKALEIGQ